MIILGSKGGGRLKTVATNLPPKLFSFVTLYAIAHKTARSRLIHEVVEDWYTAIFHDGLEDELIGKIVSRVKVSWKSYQTKHPKITYEGYLKEVETELKRKKLDKVSIKLIMKEVNNGKNE